MQASSSLPPARSASQGEPANARLANTYDLLKVLAFLSMVADHAGQYLFPEQLWWRVAGRAAMPLFLFLVGYSRSSRIPGELVGGALLVAVLDGVWRGHPLPLNILFSIILARVYLAHPRLQHWFPPLTLVLLWLPSVLIFDYGTTTLLYAWLGMRVRPAERPPLATAVTISAFHLATQLWGGYSPGQQGAITLIVLGLALGLARFRLTPLPLPYPLVLVSRYALHLYVLHLYALAALGSWLSGV